MNEEKILKKCPGCEKEISLNKKGLDAFRAVSEELYNTILNSQYCSGDCARKVIGEKDKIFRSKDG